MAKIATAPKRTARLSCSFWIMLMIPCVRPHEVQPPVTIAGHGCDEPCTYSDEWSAMK
jgi:hypothetical protein